MSISKINGIHLEQMLRNGLHNLMLGEEEINRLNVFPVPDGDTGTNMRMTLQHGLHRTRGTADAGAFLRALSDGMLLGARGNSGVILSQFFRGFYTELNRCSVLGPGEMRAGLIRGYRTAYQAVVQPVEGTILSVAREGIEHIRSQIGRSTPIDQLLAMYVAEMRKTLAYTPEMLSVLKDAGVVDSGAAGFILIFEGMLKFLRGEIIDPRSDAAPISPAAAPVETLDLSLFNENSTFTDGYCMEFILQLMQSEAYDQRFQLSAYIRTLQKRGTSLVCVQDGTRVKVHIHTRTPANIIHLSQRFGEFLTFKLENMQIQHNHRDRQQAPPKPLAVVAVANGEGMQSLFRDLCCDCVIDGGPTMNTSAQEFVEAFSSLRADAIVVLPNHKNVIPAAEQAAALSADRRVTVLPTQSTADGYFALAMDIPDSDDTDHRIQQMRRGMQNVITLCETTASQNYTYHEISCRKGEEIVLRAGELVCVSNDWKTALLDSIGMIDDIEDRETCVVFRGKSIPPAWGEDLADELAARYPLLETTVIDGGQEIYHWIIGIL